VYALSDFQDINIWREGKFEFGSDKTAIEILVGDKVLLDYLNGKESFKHVIAALKEAENSWIIKADKYRIYEKKLYRLNFNI